jgi:hypothetical protein
MLKNKILFIALTFLSTLGLSSGASALNYGSGTYGTCTYGTCGITISSSSTVTLNVTPQTGSTRCTVDKDDVSVTTGASVGYTMTLSSTSSGVTMPGGANGGTINAVGTSYGTPGVLTTNTWGYRIDSSGSFGAGPTSVVNSGAVPALTFAPIAPLASAQTIRTTSSAATPSATQIWYGVCVDMSLPADTYSRSVVYTAMTN